MPFLPAFSRIDNSSEFDDLTDAIEIIAAKFICNGVPPEMVYRVCMLYACQFGDEYRYGLHAHYHITQDPVLDTWYQHLFIFEPARVQFELEKVQSETRAANPEGALSAFASAKYYSGMTIQEIHFAFGITHGPTIHMRDAKCVIVVAFHANFQNSDYGLVRCLLNGCGDCVSGDFSGAVCRVFVDGLRDYIRRRSYLVSETTEQLIQTAASELSQLLE